MDRLALKHQQIIPQWNRGNGCKMSCDLQRTTVDQACRNPGMLGSRIPARCDLCREFWSCMFANYFIFIIGRRACDKMQSSLNSIFQNSGVSVCLLYCPTLPAYNSAQSSRFFMMFPSLQESTSPNTFNHTHLETRGNSYFNSRGEFRGVARPHHTPPP